MSLLLTGKLLKIAIIKSSRADEWYDE